jgi:hypothetical protein
MLLGFCGIKLFDLGYSTPDGIRIKLCVFIAKFRICTKF